MPQLRLSHICHRGCGVFPLWFVMRCDAHGQVASVVCYAVLWHGRVEESYFRRFLVWSGYRSGAAGYNLGQRMTQQGIRWPNHNISGWNVALANHLRACNVCIQRVPWYVVVRPGYTMLSRLPKKNSLAGNPYLNQVVFCKSLTWILSLKKKYKKLFTIIKSKYARYHRFVCGSCWCWQVFFSRFKSVI